MKLHFIESTRKYRGAGYRFDAPGEYEVDEATARRLLEQFPDWFTAANQAVETAKAAAPEGSTQEEAKTKPLSKMNKDELVAQAEALGLSVSKDMSNKQLQQAIEAHHAS